MTDLDVNSMSDGTLGAMTTKVLRHGASGAQLEIAVCGATPLTWRAPFRGELGDFLTGFVSQPDFEGQAGMRNSLMFPFANRLRNDQYTWDGVTYTVPKQCANDPEVIHGFARVNDWEVLEAELDNPDFAALSFGFTIRSGEHEWYPFDLDVTVRYEITATGLNVALSYTNVGGVDAPVGAGWHPYWQIPGHATFDDLALRVPGRVQILMDEKLVPLAGDAAYKALTEDVVHNQLADVHYDDAWDQLVPDDDGIIRTTLTEPATGAGLAVWQNRGTVLVFTGGTYPQARGAIAIEPVESTTDAFNRSDRDSDVRLAPGASREFRFGATVLDN